MGFSESPEIDNDVKIFVQNILNIKPVYRIKIGYTKDGSTLKIRESSYRTENPSLWNMALYEEGTEEDEKALHHYFKKYLCCGQEWFELREEIIQFFFNHSTIESIREDIKSSYNLLKVSELQVCLYSHLVLNIIYTELMNLDSIEQVKKGVVNKLREKGVDNDLRLLDFIKETWPDRVEEFEKVLNSRSEVEDRLLEFNNIPQFKDRLKYAFLQKHSLSE